MHAREYRIMYRVEDSHWWFVARRRFVSRMLESAEIGTPWFSRRQGPGLQPAYHGPSAKAVTALRNGMPPRTFLIADIGAGTGGMIPFLRRFGTVIGIEPNPNGRLFAKKRGIVLRNATAQRTGLRKESVDMVCFFDVLYHKGIDDTAALKEAYRILRPGGWLVITDCAFPFLSGRHDEAVGGSQRYFLSDLARKVERSGFAVQRKTYTFFVLFPLVALRRLADRFLAPKSETHSDVGNVGGIANILLAALCRLEASLLPLVSYPWGSSLLILARKASR